MNRKDIIKKAALALVALLVFVIALGAAYVSGRESGLVAPGVQVIECPADTPDVESPAEAPAEA